MRAKAFFNRRLEQMCNACNTETLSYLRSMCMPFRRFFFPQTEPGALETSNFALHRERDEDDDDERSHRNRRGSLLPGRSRGIQAYFS